MLKKKEETLQESLKTVWKRKKKKRTVDSDKKAEISLKIEHTHIWNDKRSVSKPNT